MKALGHLFLLIVLAACAWGSGDVQCGTLVKLPPTGPQPIVTTPQGREKALYDNSYALLISNSQYLGPSRRGWDMLPETGAELDRVATVLRKQGFNVWRVSDPTGKELVDHFRDFMAEFGHQPNNRLVFFFAGHGYTPPGSPTSYLVPVDASDPTKDPADFYRKALPIGYIETWAKELEVRHALFVFDSCYSGSIFTTRGAPTAPEMTARTSDRWRWLTDQAARPVRQFIAAGGPNETLPAKSDFVPLFIEALEGRASGVGDGYVTGGEIGSWIAQTLPTFNPHQSPHSGFIRVPELSFGDLIFQPAPSAAAHGPVGIPVQRSPAQSAYVVPQSILVLQREDAKNLFEYETRRFGIGISGVTEVISANNMLLQAELSLNTEPLAQIAAYEAALKRAKELESRVAKGVLGGISLKGDEYPVRLHRSQLEVDLARHQSGAVK